MFEEKETKKGRKPDFQDKNNGISIWKHHDKNNKEYLSVSIPLLSVRTNVFSTDYLDEKKADEKAEEIQKEPVA